MLIARVKPEPVIALAEHSKLWQLLRFELVDGLWGHQPWCEVGHQHSDRVENKEPKLKK